MQDPDKIKVSKKLIASLKSSAALQISPSHAQCIAHLIEKEEENKRQSPQLPF